MRQGLLVLGRKRIQQFLSLIVVICLSCSILLNLLNPWWEHDDDFIMSHSEPLMEQQNRNAVIMSNTHVRQQQRRTMAPQNSSHNTIGYIHIGKTGGSTISNLLRNGCHSFSGSKPCRKNIANETIISKLVEHYYHVSCDIPDLNIHIFLDDLSHLKLNDISTFLILILRSTTRYQIFGDYQHRIIVLI